MSTHSSSAALADKVSRMRFLQAGYARVVIPVRLGFARAVHCYLYTGLPWRGGELPPVGDKSQNPLYLDVAEELKALTGGGESGSIDEPIGEPWEYTLPTTVLKLRPDDQLPSWHRVVPKGSNPTAYSSDAPDGDWTWADGDPP
ncbi:hypothetical protein [Paraburkholderia sp. MM6662-R1]|uniref:hypothetical protein n=1 Tax=Paraburkholderia sp. MM6662-R1 TaxID=2991066 RepID=UPI003D23C59E